LASKKKPSGDQVRQESALVTAAKAIGGAAGKIASLAGVTPEAPAAATSVKKKKLPAKKKSRLPRRRKKSQGKAPAS
jgi:hypothetical protein